MANWNQRWTKQRTIRSAAADTTTKSADELLGSDAFLRGVGQQISGGHLPGSRLDWKREAGHLWENSAVSACISYAADTLPEAPFVVRRPGKTKTGRQTMEIVPDHPLTRLLRRPGGTLAKGGAALPAALYWKATTLSLLADGNAYWILLRNAAARIVQIKYVPHWCIEPKSDDGVNLTHYEYRPGRGVTKRLDPADVIHFRVELDPANPLKGRSRLKTVLREVVTDNEATTYTAAILKNMGIPGVILTPKEGDVKMKSGFKERVKELWEQLTKGDRRGGAIAFEEAFDVTFPGFSPEQLVLDKIRAIPESRIAAALRVPALVVGLLVGDQTKTYANYQEARRAAYESMVIPLQELIADTLEVQLLPQMVNEAQASDECGWDRSAVACLQEEVAALWKRATEALKAGGIKRSEFKQILDLDVDEAQDDVYLNPSAAGSSPDGGDDGTDPAKPKAQDKAADDVRAQWQKVARERRKKAEEEGTD